MFCRGYILEVDTDILGLSALIRAIVSVKVDPRLLVTGGQFGNKQITSSLCESW